MKIIERIVKSAGVPGDNDLWLKEEGNNLSLKAHHNGGWKTVAGGGDTPSPKTPDWDVNDPSAPGYIANRPFYEESGIDEIKDARIYFVSGAQDYSKFIYVKGEKRYYFDFSLSDFTWKLATVDGDYVITVNSETGEFNVVNEEIGYSAKITPGSLIPDADSGDSYYETSQDMDVLDVVVHKIDEKYLPEPETVMIKIVHGTLSGSNFTESEGELSLQQALAHIILSGGVVAIHVTDDQNGVVMAYSTSVLNDVITFTGNYSWG